MAVMVCLPLSPTKALGAKEDHTTNLPEDHSIAALTGTKGKSIVSPHEPAVAGGGGRAAPSKTLTSAIDVQGPRPPASERAVILTYRALAGVKMVVLSFASSR